MSIRAVRNNNPGNIRIGTNWRGLMPRAQMNPDQLAETEFCVFQSAQWGFRAIATILHTYVLEDKLDTIAGFITRWAPPSENDTAAYIQDIVTRTGVAAGVPYPVDDQAHMAVLCKAISIHEVGAWAFQDSDVIQGVETAH